MSNEGSSKKWSRARWSTVGLLVAVMFFGRFAPVSAQDAATADSGTVVADGFNGPQGLLVNDDGSVLVIDSGTGGDQKINIFSSEAMTNVEASMGQTARIVSVAADGSKTDVADLPSLLVGDEGIGGARLAKLGDLLFATVGQFSSTPDNAGIPNFAVIDSVGNDGKLKPVASGWDYERSSDPDGTGFYDSHPYGLTAGPDGALYVADAGANDIWRLDLSTGKITTIGVLPPLPGVFPSDVYKGQTLTDAVPTSIIFDQDGNAYVSYLSGAPFVPGSSGVKMIAKDGTVSDYATGLTMLTQILWGPNGHMYGTEFGVFTDQGPTPNSGKVVHIDGGTDFTDVVTGLSAPTSLGFNAAGDLFVTTNGLGAPGSGQLVKFTAVATGEGGEAAAPSASGSVTETEAMTDTGATTETEAATATGATTETEAAAATGTTTETEAATATGATTETAAATATGTTTETETASGTVSTGDIPGANCDDIISHEELTKAISDVVAAGDSGGFGLNMWATVVNRDGIVCAIAYSGANRGDQWPGSRVISAQKANTANAFSLPGLALSTANLYTAVQPGGTLFGLQESNPVDPAVAYGGDPTQYGQEDDPMVGQRLGGINVFGGGLALYNENGEIVGGLGVSGDTSCTDHIVAWKVRDELGLDFVPKGVSPTNDDNIIFDKTSGWGHPECGLGEVDISNALPTAYPIGAK